MAPAANGSGSDSVSSEFWYDRRSRGWSEGVRGSDMVWWSLAWSMSYSYERIVPATDLTGGRCQGAWMDVWVDDGLFAAERSEAGVE